MIRWVVTGIALVWLAFGLWLSLSGLQLGRGQPPSNTGAQAWCEDNTVEVGDAAVELGLIDESEIDDTVDALVAVGNMEARRPTDYTRACEAAFAARSR